MRKASETDSKYCNGCQETKPLSDFYFRRTGRSQGRPCSRCKKCDIQRHMVYQKTEHARQRIKARLAALPHAYAYRLKWKFGLTAARYESMSASQRGGCAICGSEETTKDSYGGIRRLSVDHCHETGKVRGLLCQGCNHAIGSFKDDSTLMRRAADYIEKHMAAAMMVA